MSTPTPHSGPVRTVAVRPYAPADADAVGRLALRAWGAVFAEVERSMAPALFATLYPHGWGAHQARAVRNALATPSLRTWIAEPVGDPADEASGGAGVVGFVSVVLHEAERAGEVHLIAVDPDWQGAGVGHALVERAVDWMRESGMELAVVETGADAGHGPARRAYERAGFEGVPIVRYFKRL